MFEIKKIDDVCSAKKEIISLHEKVFCQMLGFNAAFKEDVEEYLYNFSEQYNNEQDGLFVAYLQKKIMGSIIIDSTDPIETNTTRIRLFIVSPKCWGQGIGKKLLKTSLNFCRKKKFNKVLLGTFKELKTANHLYLKEDFQMVEEREVDYWEQPRVEQKFTLKFK